MELKEDGFSTREVNLCVHFTCIYQKGSSEIKRHLNFRDYMINHLEEARQYGQLKIHLCKQYPTGIDALQEGKKGFIHALDQKAAVWA